MKLVECVPNFSEGRDSKIINSITSEIEQTEGATLLDVDPGQATNRTVVTFIGTPEGVEEAAFKAIKRAAELIDMQKHQGAHARMGATDVCPFVPVSGITIEECIQIARELAQRVATELGIPIYLYEDAATQPERQNLATIRQGEYEGLPEKLKDPAWQPDFGEPVFNARSGATVIGVREFLIAYNINLNTKITKIARSIGNTIREKGKFKRGPDKKLVRDEDGKKIRVPGLFQHCKATGWFIEEYGQAQVTMNLTNYKVTPPHLVLETVRDLAQDEGVVVTGSELVGLIPESAMLEAGRYYLQKQGASAGVPVEELIKVAVQSMSLDQLSPFDPQQKIIENRVRIDKLVAMPVRAFTDETSTDSPAPGGGSVSALGAALSAALSAMVANLTFSKKGFKDLQPVMEETAQAAQSLKDEFLQAIDLDTDAFNKVMAAFRLPRKSDEEKAIREKAVQAATCEATLVPFHVLEKIPKLLDLAELVIEQGNPNSLSDAGVANTFARSAAVGVYYNVMINLASISDEEFVQTLAQQAETLKKQIIEKANTLEEKVSQRLIDDLAAAE
ncbi:glutamate formimidoyltransferase [candidate division CSSED10-310 bacterium]|uniref:Formimidoyltransferase-cyclodeaminase n=1 Tax=candidate division CSSED10-310 bacterium TaxID=2855610 RepID=A0ABV6YU69_UNCC1